MKHVGMKGNHSTTLGPFSIERNDEEAEMKEEEEEYMSKEVRRETGIDCA